MTEPITTQKSLIVPNTGDLAGTWGTAALNPNFQIIDAMFGGVTTISLTSATTILLSVPATTGIWGGSVPQSSNAMIVFTGAQTGPSAIQFTLPGFYIVNNKCTGTSYIQLAPVTGTGTRVCAPPGRKAHIFFDGTDIDYVDMPEVSSRLDLFGVSTTPVWMQNCTVLPYLVRDGSVHTASLYPQLAQILGSTFGGNGVTTFAVPDSRSRVDVGIDIAKVVGGGLADRLTTAICGFSGTTMAAAGGDQNMQLHSHAVNDPEHSHDILNAASVAFDVGGQTGWSTLAGGKTTETAATNITIGNAGAGSSQNVQPTIVSFLPLIKT